MGLETRMKSIFGAAILMISVLASPAHAAGRAADTVAVFQDSLIGVMREADKLGVSGRYERLKPVIENAFNLPLMAGISAGTHWQAASPDQRQRLVSAFGRMSAATLATLFSGYSGEMFELVGESPGPQNTTVVMTKLVIPDRDNVEIAYIARKHDDAWRLIDVIVDRGISELKVRMSEYRLVLKQSGIEALIDLLNTKADELIGK